MIHHFAAFVFSTEPGGLVLLGGALLVSGFVLRAILGPHRAIERETWKGVPQTKGS